MDLHKIDSYGIPDQTAPDAEKASYEYGMSCGNFIENEWFNKENNVNTFYDSREEMETLRLYARGEQDPAIYKTQLSQDGDNSFLALDWKPIPVIPKHVDLLVNGMQDRIFDVKAVAQDEISVSKKKADFDMMEAEMKLKEELLAITEVSGVNVFENDPATLPEDDEEFEIFKQLQYKQQVEIAAETAVSYVFEANRYYDTKKKIDKDLVEIGKAVAKHSYDPVHGVKIEYVDPANVVHSYTNDEFFSDLYYIGEVKRINVSDLIQMFPHIKDDEDILLRIRQSGASHFETFGVPYTNVSESNESKESNKVEVLYFTWKTTRNVIHKIRNNRKGGKKAVRRDESLMAAKSKDAGRYNKTQRVEEVIYEGVKVLGDAGLLLKWEIQKNITRPKSSTSELVMPFVVVAPNYTKGIYDSIVKRITQFADKIHIIDLQIQKLIQKVVPPGLRIDPDAIANVDMGNGEHMNLREVINMYTQTGTIFARSLDREGDRVAGEPVVELPGSQMQQLQGLLLAQQYYYQEIQKATGINEARDAADPDPRALVGVQKIAAANSNTATRHILHGSITMTERLAEAASLRIQDVIKHHPEKDRYKNAIGRVNVGVLGSLDDLTLHDFGIFIEIEPDEEEKAFLEQNIQLALGRDSIYLEDAIDVRNINNVHLANQVLKSRRKKKEATLQQQEQQKQQAVAESNAAAAQQAEQAKQQTAQIQNEMLMAQEAQKNELAIAKLQSEKEFEKEILMMKHELEMKLLQAQQSFDSGQQDKQNANTNAMKDKEMGILDQPFADQGLASGPGLGGPAPGEPGGEPGIPGLEGEAPQEGGSGRPPGRPVEGGQKPKTAIGLNSRANTIDQEVKGKGLLQN